MTWRTSLLRVRVDADIQASPAQDTLADTAFHCSTGARRQKSTHATSLPARLPQGRQLTIKYAAINPFGRGKPAVVSSTTDAQAPDLVSARRCGVTAVTAAAGSSQLKEEIVEET